MHACASQHPVVTNLGSTLGNGLLLLAFIYVFIHVCVSWSSWIVNVLRFINKI